MKIKKTTIQSKINYFVKINKNNYLNFKLKLIKRNNNARFFNIEN